MALTATADDPTRRDIATRLRLEAARVFAAGYDRPNIFYRVIEKQQPREDLLRFLNEEHSGNAGIVYCLTRRAVEETAAWLSARGREALPYHAGLAPEVRARHQERFLREEGIIVVATVAFGMGIDKPNVRFVAHLDAPKNLEAYYQETGRAGRDGLPADAWMSYGLADVMNLRRLMEASDINEQQRRIERQKSEALIGFCETLSCRRQALLAYFGERREEACGYCDNCRDPSAESWDGTVAAQKALSAVYRTGQRFGAHHLADVLTGHATERVRSLGHNNLKTFGVGTECDARGWLSVIRQLIAQGHLQPDPDGHGGLVLARSAAEVLRGQQEIRLRREAPRPRARRRQPGAMATALDPAADALWQKLRAWRLDESRRQELPPYVIFHDATLIEVARRRPSSLAALGDIPGIGRSKLDRYGDAVLAVISGADDPG
jgi:ATP-dependent DNA helicase RecQ